MDEFGQKLLLVWSAVSSIVPGLISAAAQYTRGAVASFSCSRMVYVVPALSLALHLFHTWQKNPVVLSGFCQCDVSLLSSFCCQLQKKKHGSNSEFYC